MVRDLRGIAALWQAELGDICALRNVQVIDSFMPEYDEARTLYNRSIDLRPALIVRTLDPEILRRGLVFSFDNSLPVAIRGGGHHIGGFGSCSGGIVFDFSPFRRVDYAQDTHVLEVQAGALLEDVDRVLAANHRALPLGTVSNTGIAGLTLGGGIGWLARPLGLTCDFLIGADVLTTEGEIVQAEDPQHAELLWALRGGGGGFGIVLAFRYATVPMRTFQAGSIHLKEDDLEAQLLTFVEELERRCPSNLTVAPIISRDRNGEAQVQVDYCLWDQETRNPSEIIPLTGKIEHHPFNDNFAAWQSNFDANFLPPLRGYWKACYTDRISRSDIRAVLAAILRHRAERANILIEHLGGAVAERSYATSVFPLRQKSFGILITAQWGDESDDKQNREWARQTYAALDPSDEAQTYMNYAADGNERASGSFNTDVLTALARVKLTYDPRNLLSRNHTAKVLQALYANQLIA